MPHLSSATITFHTRDDDKDHDTRLSIEIEDATGIRISRIDGFDGLRDRFPDNTERSIDLPDERQA